jgi:N-acetylglucosamine-6-sulfatase
LLLCQYPQGSPDLILVLTDDMDLKLGALTPLTRTKMLLASHGASAKNYFIHTPICCPSRAELLTGRYYHNLKTNNPTDKGCMHMNVSLLLNTSNFYGDQYFAPYLQKAGYTVGIFGKHLNNGYTPNNPMCPPAGVDKWFANGGGSYYNPEFNAASAGGTAAPANFKNCSASGGGCYSTSVIGNHSIAWIKSVIGGAKPRKPYFAYIAPKAPHIEDGPGWPVAMPAPWYNNSLLFGHLKAPRTPNWNQSCKDHHWLVRTQPPMTAEQEARTDELFRARWRALLSVDDLVDAVVQTLDEAGTLASTYILFTSDHGFHLGTCESSLLFPSLSSASSSSLLSFLRFFFSI